MEYTLKQYQKRVEKIIGHSQNLFQEKEIDAKRIIKKWYKNKKHYIKMFGDYTIVPIDFINITKGNYKKNTAIKIIRKMYAEILQTIGKDKIEKMSNFTLYQYLTANWNGFFENKIVDKEHENLGFIPGSKLIKRFNKFFLNYADLRVAQDIASKYIEKSKIQGTLYISVDPVDFLTISERKNDWGNCHSLNGGYRGGNINYMIDKTTLIVYIADNKREKLYRLPEEIPWNNKKWRILIHTDQFNNIIIYNKQYPFQNNQLLKIVYQSLCNFFNLKFDLPIVGKIKKDFSKSIDKFDYENIYTKIITPSQDVIPLSKLLDFSDYTGFCDLLHAKDYIPVFSLASKVNFYKNKENFTKKNFDKVFSLKIGERYRCMVCNEEIVFRSNGYFCFNPKCKSFKKIKKKKLTL